MKIVYVYGLLDEDDNIFYVGKSTEPKRRLIAHDGENKRCKILDKFEDIEHYWIEKLTEEGNQLTNKEKLTGGEDWEIGDIITSVDNRGRLRATKLLHIPSGVIYNSGYQASKSLGLNDYSLINTLKKSPNSKYHKIFTILED